MTNQEFTTLLKNPELVKADDVPQLKEFVEVYPYFVPTRMLYLRALQKSNSIHFGNELSHAVLHAHDRRWLYYFVYPEKKKENEQKYVRQEKNSGGYFGMLNAVEQDGKDINQSLKTLAERLKRARSENFSETNAKPKESTVPRINIAENQELEKQTKNLLDNALTKDNYMEKIKLLISGKKYSEALAILKELNLNNPKKSIYFADQIRFLEKIIDNKTK